MCDLCHYFTEGLIQMIRDDAQITRELDTALLADDSERITNLRKALQECEQQISVNRQRMTEHLRVDHARISATASVGV